MTKSRDSIFSATNRTYLAEIYERYLEDPTSIDKSWSSVFEELQDDVADLKSEIDKASWAKSTNKILGHNVAGVDPAVNELVPFTPWASNGVAAAARDTVRARILIRSYRVRGHLNAQFDPLGLEGGGDHKDLDYRTYGFTVDDLERPIYLDSYNSMAGNETATLREILKTMKDAYCSSIGVEYMHIQEIEERTWIQEQVEGIDYRLLFSEKKKKSIFLDLVQAEGFENFLQIKHTGSKRFGLDGGESVIPCVEQILYTAALEGIEEVVLGMPHRGRLNVLTRTMRKPYVAVFSEFQGAASTPDDVHGSGDVKYHLGTSADRVFEGNKIIHLSLTANPSHLEAVNPVVLGKVRAKQTQKGDEARAKVMGLLMHGDAAFAGQGLVPESLDLSQLRGYRTGGTIHIIVNNQIGFTTNPSSSRSTPYSTDIAKGLQVPIFHVNGDDPEAVVRAAYLAMQFRQKFKRDAVIDIFCYRRHGHNEGDEPMFTQPLMYKAIAKHPTTLMIYRDKLITQGVLTYEEADKIVGKFQVQLDEEFKAASNYKPNKADWLEGHWDGLTQLHENEEKSDEDTSVNIGLLKEIGNSITKIPERINVNSKLDRQLKSRAQMIETGKNIDWATAEALAFGSLLVEGIGVRLSGQDSGRGTFSQRHAVITDQETEEKHFPLSELNPDQAQFEVMDSPLSEFAVLGYEYGFSLAEPNTLTVWEAQFGDFANTAQVIMDQFISSGESKWLRMSGLVQLLPHGMEGQGPEHSSARLERYLQLCAEENMQVVNITSPANYFHVLRRQVKRNFRKPLILMAPKSLLRHKLNTSNLEQMASGTRFRRVLKEVDSLVPAYKVNRVILCSGKVYFDLLEARREKSIDKVAIIRLEQLYPWPRANITRQLECYPNAEIVWCQEEPANMGAWNFVIRRLEYIMEDIGLNKNNGRPIYVGRPNSASPATGLLRIHNAEQTHLINQALNWEVRDLIQPYRRASAEKTGK